MSTTTTTTTTRDRGDRYGSMEWAQLACAKYAVDKEELALTTTGFAPHEIRLRLSVVRVYKLYLHTYIRQRVRTDNYNG